MFGNEYMLFGTECSCVESVLRNNAENSHFCRQIRSLYSYFCDCIANILQKTKLLSFYKRISCTFFSYRYPYTVGMQLSAIQFFPSFARRIGGLHSNALKKLFIRDFSSHLSNSYYRYDAALLFFHVYLCIRWCRQ